MYPTKYINNFPFQAIVPNLASGVPVVFPESVEYVSLYVDNPAYINFDENWATGPSGGFYIDNVVTKIYTSPESARISKISLYAPSGAVTIRGQAWN